MHNQYTLLFESIAANQYTFIYIVLYILLEILYLTKYIYSISKSLFKMPIAEFTSVCTPLEGVGGGGGRVN